MALSYLPTRLSACLLTQWERISPAQFTKQLCEHPRDVQSTCMFCHFDASVMMESSAGNFALLSQEALEGKTNPLFSFQQVMCSGAHAADLRSGACTGAEGLVHLQDLAWCTHRNQLPHPAVVLGEVHVVEMELFQSKCWGL